MVRHIQNPFGHIKEAQVYDISAELFFCLIQLYLDFSKKNAGFELAAYYEIYLQVSENKRVLSTLLTPKANFSAYLETYIFDYDIANQKQIFNSQNALKEISENLHIYTFMDNLKGLTLPALVLKNMHLAYKIFLSKNKKGCPLTWHSYNLAILEEEALIALAIYPAIDPNDWMGGVLGGLHGYMTFDLKKKLVLQSNIRDWGVWNTINNEEIERKKHNKRVNKKLRRERRQALNLDHLQSDMDNP